MKILTDGLKITNLPFAEHLVLSSREALEVDAGDGEPLFPRHWNMNTDGPSSQIYKEKWLCTWI